MYLHFQFGHNIFPVVPASSFSDLTLHVLYDVCVCVCVFSTEYIPKNQAIPRRQLFCESTQQQPLARYMCVCVSVRAS